MAIGIIELASIFAAGLSAFDNADLTINGTSTIELLTVEARVLRRDNDAVIKDWTPLTSVLKTSTTWSGTLEKIPGTLALLYYEVRDTASPGTVASSTEDFITSFNVADIGQSNDRFSIDGQMLDSVTPLPFTYKISTNYFVPPEPEPGIETPPVDTGCALLANKIQIATGRPVVIFNAAVLASTVSDWTPPSSIYTVFKNLVTGQAASKLHNIHWLQGESEAQAQMSTAVYQPAESNFFDQCRVDFLNPFGGPVPITNSLLPRGSGGGIFADSWEWINTAKLQNARDYINCETFTILDVPLGGDVIHYDASGRQACIERFAEYSNYLIGSASEVANSIIESYSVISPTETEITLKLKGAAADIVAVDVDTFSLTINGIVTAVPFSRNTATTLRGTHTSGTVTKAVCFPGNLPEIVNPLVDDLGNVPLPNYDITEASLKPLVEITGFTPVDVITADVAGTSSIPSGSIVSVEWVNNRGGSGICASVSTPIAEDVPILKGTNIITFTVTSDLGIKTQDEIVITGAVLQEYDITASPGVNGSISPVGAVGVPYNTDQMFIMTADPGYHIEDVLVDLVSVGSGGAYTFNNVLEDHTISVSFVSNSLDLMVDITSPTSDPTYETNKSSDEISGTAEITGTITNITAENITTGQVVNCTIVEVI